MTPREFVKKWRASALKERSAAQEHFLDLCELLGHGKPAALDPTGEFFCFEKGAEKRGGEDGFADVWKRGFFAWEYKGKHADLQKAWEQLDLYHADLENPPLLVTCDTARFEIHTSFQNTKHVVYPIALEELVQPEKLEFLRAVFFEPEKLRPGRISPVVTADAAKALGELAQRLRDRQCEPRQVARFLDRILFALFAEDVGLLPNEVASKLFETARGAPELFEQLVGELFRKMADGGYFGVDRIPRVNGSLFDDAATLPLTGPELELLAQAARLDWSAIDPSIFGTLFERGLDPGKRSQLGAHYTSREDIETLVEPVVMAPLRREWEEVKALVVRLLTTGSKAAGAKPKALAGAALTKARAEAEIFLLRFLDRLERVKVLDPACGSGNFLYVTLRKLKDLESEVYDCFLDQGLHAPLRVGVGPWQLYGIEINAYAHELAQMTVWIGYLQWLRQHGTTTWKEPILQAMSNIEHKDAILDLSDPEHPKEPEWPAVDFIVSNPPFLGARSGMRAELGDEYVDKLQSVWSDRVKSGADLCCYWLEKASEEMVRVRATAAGLLATQSVRKGSSRSTLDRLAQRTPFFFAESDREWILDGAAVRIAMIGFSPDPCSTPILDGKRVARINSDLTAGANITVAVSLSANRGLAFQGSINSGSFDIDDRLAMEFLTTPNPTGLPTSSVLRPWLNGRDFTSRRSWRWLIDFGVGMAEADAAQFERPFEYVRREVRVQREGTKYAPPARYPYWQLWNPRPEMRIALARSTSFLVTSRVSKHRFFAFEQHPTFPDARLVAFASESRMLLGVLSSRAHSVWALRQASRHGDGSEGGRPTYNLTTCFETFPFPALDAISEAAIGAAAKDLDDLRRTWLNPPEWTREEVLEFPGSVDSPWRRFVHEPNAKGIGTVRWPRIVARDAERAAKLAKRTLTNLYNERPTWLVHAHRKLDEAVFAAYGWPPDLGDEAILERLLALNLERSARERGEPT